MRKILYYSDFGDFGGAETYLAELASSLDRNSFEPVCVCVRSAYSSRLTDRLKGIKIYELSFPKLWINLGRIVLKEDPEIVHLNMNVPFSCFFMLFVLRLMKFKNIIATVHSTVSPRSRYPFVGVLKGMLCQMLFPAVSKFICVSRRSKTEFCNSYNQQENKVVVVHNGIRPFLNRPCSDAEIGKAKKSFGIANGTRVVGCVARLDKDKGLEFLLKAFSAVSTKYEDVVCLVVGDGMDKKRLKKLVGALGISDRVVFSGYVDDKARIYAAIDYFVLPSLHEAFPLTILEAMRAGRPVIATSVGGIPELIEEGVTGFVVPPKDSDAIKHSLEFLLDNRPLAEKMSFLGMKRAEGLFSLENMVKNTERVYGELSGCLAC